MKKSTGICTDGAEKRTRCRLGVAAKVKNIGHPDILSIHCIICVHREHLVVKKRPQK